MPVPVVVPALLYEIPFIDIKIDEFNLTYNGSFLLILLVELNVLRAENIIYITEILKVTIL
jgi:hypothetical protein